MGNKVNKANRARNQNDQGINEKLWDLPTLKSPLVAERKAEEDSIGAYIAASLDVVARIAYTFDDDGDFFVVMSAANNINFQYIVCVKVADKENLSWSESRAIETIVRFGTRGLAELSMGVFMDWMESLSKLFPGGNVRIQDIENDKAVLHIVPEPAAKAYGPGRISKLQINSGNYFTFTFSTDMNKYCIAVHHEVVEMSFSAQQTKAFSDICKLSEPGEKMDDSIFLKHCARLKSKYNLIRVQRNENVLTVVLAPTSSVKSNKVFNGDIPLPDVTQGPLEWSPETARRAAAAADDVIHEGINCDGCGRRNFSGIRYKCKSCYDYDLCSLCYGNSVTTKSHQTNHPVDVIPIPIKRNQANNQANNNQGNNNQGVNDAGLKFAAERALEEAAVDQFIESHTQSITKVLYRFDPDGYFTIRIREGSAPHILYLLKIRVQNQNSITQNECKAMQDCLTLAKRITTTLSADIFKNWGRFLGKKYRITEQNARGTNMISVTPPAGPSNYDAGKIRTLSITLDKDDDYVIAAQTNADTCTFIINHSEFKESYSALQELCFCDILSIVKPGDNMSESVFLNYCLNLKNKYNLLQTFRKSANNVVAHIVPTTLSEEDTGIQLRYDVPLPGAGGGNKANNLDNCRFYCDGCREREFPGKKYVCTECNNYLLCQTCFDNSVCTLNHQSSHPIRVVDPSKANNNNNNQPNPLFPTYNNNRCYATSLLKKSGQADVYKGILIDRENRQKDVALKVYHDNKDWDDCKNELRSLMRISGHANIMEVIDFYEVPKPCVVMPFINGGDLRDYLDKNGAMAKPRALSVLRGIAAGLRYLHNNQIVHRDLKSPNVVLQLPSFSPVLIDLGLGKALSKDLVQQTNAPKGTILWMAPEMLTDRRWSVKTDIFAMGIIMWEVVTGLTPYDDMNNLAEIIRHILSDGRPKMSKVNEIQWVRSYNGFTKLMQDSWSSNPDVRPTAEILLNGLARD